MQTSSKFKFKSQKLSHFLRRTITGRGQNRDVMKPFGATLKRIVECQLALRLATSTVGTKQRRNIQIQGFNTERSE